ncbi:MAG: phosphatase PAP2 family protein, partial [Bacteroidetes bacterium]|nr:phosphatase PAP2 family protein [Bacteroidota bacterium]
MSFAPGPDSAGTRTLGSDVCLALSAVGYTLSSPVRWDGTDVAKAGLFTAGAVGSFYLDEDVREWMLKNRSPALDAVERIGFYYGSPVVMMSLMVVFYSTGAWCDNVWLLDTGTLFAAALMACAIIQEPVRISAGRARPETGEGSMSFKFMGGWPDERASFYSGHCAIAFSMSSILSRMIKNPYASVGLYTLAATTTFGRVYSDRHWLSDVFVGTVLGIAVGHSVMGWYEGSQGNGSSLSV